MRLDSRRSLDTLVGLGFRFCELSAEGGGGFGDPCERAPDRVLRDVMDELLSREAAETIYGMKIDEGRIDSAATQRLRSAR